MNTTEDWTKAVADESVLPEVAATLISQSLIRNRYVIDKPADGYIDDGGYPESPSHFEVTSPEEGHYDFDQKELVKANRVLRKLTKTRMQAVLDQLKHTNPDLAARLPLDFLTALTGEHEFISGIITFVFAIIILATSVIIFGLILRLIKNFTVG